MFKKLSPPFIAFLQATGLVVYIIILSFFFNFISPSFSNSSAQFYAPIIMLLLFTISAVVCALLFLGRAGVLFWEKKYKESFSLIGYTLAWGLLYFVLFIFALSIN